MYAGGERDLKGGGDDPNEMHNIHPCDHLYCSESAMKSTEVCKLYEIW